MKRLVLGGLLACLVMTSNGCCVVDRLFNCHRPCRGWGPGTPCAGPSCGGCETCGGGGYTALDADYHGAFDPANSGALRPRPNCRSCATNGGPSGPPTGAVAYPYYTTRGPRDFLAQGPMSIGP